MTQELSYGKSVYADIQRSSLTDTKFTDQSDLLTHDDISHSAIVDLPRPLKTLHVDGERSYSFYRQSDLLPTNFPEQLRPPADWLVKVQSSTAFNDMVRENQTKIANN